MLTISANGIATEKVFDGCCAVAWTLTFSVDHASGTHAHGELYVTLKSATFNENPNPGSPEPQKRGAVARAMAPRSSYCYGVTSARSIAMLIPELALFRLPVLTIVTVCEPAASVGLVHAIPEAFRADA